jgi:hypothetical protein
MIYYRAKKDNFIWKAGAIVQIDPSESDPQYGTISDVWDNVIDNQDTYVSDRRNIENNPDWWERVYEVEPKPTEGEPAYETADQHLQSFRDRFPVHGVGGSGGMGSYSTSQSRHSIISNVKHS